MLKRFGVLLLIALLIMACGRKKPVTAPAPPAAPPAPQPMAADLWPSHDLHATFNLLDQGAAQPVVLVEELLREDNRLVATQNGAVYASWLLAQDGVWRPDPRGGGALLRYLPAVLHDGDAWKQTSGDAEVWFALHELPSPCPADVATTHCWQLTVLNRGEKTVFSFAAGLGPVHATADNWADPSRSFVKSMQQSRPGDLGASTRGEFLKQLPPPTPAPAPITSVSSADFPGMEARMRQAALPPGTQRINLDGHGGYVEGPLGVWTTAPVILHRANGTVYATGWKLGPSQQQQITLLDVPGAPQAAILQEVGDPDKPHDLGFGMIIGDQLQGLCCTAPKITFDRVNRIAAGSGGQATSAWLMGDPAQHKRIRHYNITWQDGQPRLRVVETSYEPAGAALVYPDTREAVLYAAFFARWFGLRSEVPVYFAAPDQAAAFADDRRTGGPDWEPGRVNLGKVEPSQYINFAPKATPSEYSPDGSIGFVAEWGGYEWWGWAWGSVRFSQDTRGRWQIAELKVAGSGVGGE